RPRRALLRQSRRLLRHVRLELRRPARLLPPDLAGAGALRLRLPLRAAAELAPDRAADGQGGGPRRRAAAEHAQREREPDRGRRAAARAHAAEGARDLRAADGARARPPVPVDGDAAPLDAPARHDRRRRARAERLRRAQRRCVHGAPRRDPCPVVHHARAHRRGPRGDDDRGPARAPARRRVRADGRAPVRLLYPRPDRLGLGARRRQPEPDARRDPARDGRQPLPLRHLSEDRGGNSDVARLIRTEKEVEGRYTEQWIVVEEDALDQWPAGPRTIVGRPATRVDGRERATGQAVYTADVQLPGMLHAAVLRSPHARARGRRPDLDAARAAPGARAVVGPDDLEVLTAEPSYQGHAVAAVAADSFEAARDALERLAPEWEVLEPLLDPEEAVRRGSLLSEPRRHDRGDFD